MNLVQTTQRWWERSDLRYDNGHLMLAGQQIEALSRAAGKPSFFYSGARVVENIRRLNAALKTARVQGRVLYAMKANRYAPLLTYMKATGLCGIDACSPNEMQLARQCGFEGREISYTNTSVSAQDIQSLALNPDVRINLDSLSAIRRLATASPGRTIGIRVNPGLGVSYGENELLSYSGAKTTKFGIYRDAFPEALALATSLGLKVRGIHFHTGCGYLNTQLPAWRAIVKECCWFLDQIKDPMWVNLGGGLGVPHVENDKPLDLDAWSAIVRDAFAGRGLEVFVEPGDYIVKDAGLLALEVNTVERKRDITFVGVSGGWNLAMEPTFYKLPCEPVVTRFHGDPAIVFHPSNLKTVSIAGHINEALDIWASNAALPPIAEGDILAFLNAGGYASAMASNHCMRGDFAEHLIL
jgi:diaminopimelate decarboxylase